MLGYLERNEADIAYQVFRPAQLEDDIVIVGPTVFPTGLKIISARGEASTKKNDMLNVTSKLATVTYVYLFICFIFASATLAYLLSRQGRQAKRKPLRIKRYYRAMLRSAWELLITLVDQENLNAISWPSRVVWTSFCWAIFMLIFAVLLNLMSVDGIVGQPPQRIDRVIDLFQGPYSEARVGMMKSFYYYATARSARSDSKLGILYQRMLRNDDCSDFRTCNLVDIDPTKLETSMKGLKMVEITVSELGFAFLADHSIYELLGKPLICLTRPDLGPKTHLSSDEMLTDYASVYFSKQTNRQLIKWMSYRLTSFLLESYSLKITAEKMLISFCENGPILYQEAAFRKCLDGVRPENGDPAGGLTFALFRKTHIASIFGISLAFSALIVECRAIIARFAYVYL
ncbi:hypothetical protein HDE_11162 [Halotydeus destructor]|nr:hypothetical protein HDE_11162 [Halotydeus destructor]